MVRIIDGEIVQDNDPRLQARQRPAPSRQQGQPQEAGFMQFTAERPQAAPRPAPPVAGFNWSAPPFKAIPSEYGSMLPDVEVYGLRVPGAGLVAVAALGMFFGWRGLLGGLVVGYLYLVYGQGAAGAAAGQGRPAAAARAGAAAGGGDGFMQQAFGSMMGAGGASTESQGQAAAAATAGPAAVWTGKGRKLGSD